MIPILGNEKARLCSRASFHLYFYCSELGEIVGQEKAPSPRSMAQANFNGLPRDPLQRPQSGLRFTSECMERTSNSFIQSSAFTVLKNK